MAEAAGGGEDATGTARPAADRTAAQCPLKLLPAAMTPPRAARRGVRLRERRRRPPRGGVGTRGWPRGSGEGLGPDLLAGPRVRAGTRVGALLK